MIRSLIVLWGLSLQAQDPWPYLPPTLPPMRAGAELPPLCRPQYGETYFKTSWPSGMYFCLSPDMWSPMALGPDLPGNVVVKDDNNNVPMTSTTLGPKTIGAGSSQLPAAAACRGCITVVTDGQTSSDCTAGGGTVASLCRSSGTAWVGIGGGGVAGITSTNQLVSIDRPVSIASSGTSAFIGTPGVCSAISGGVPSGQYGFTFATGGIPTVCDHAGTATRIGPYTLPTASDSVLGGVKVGDGLSITDGVLSASVGGGSVTPGSDGQVLSSDSTQAGNPAWEYPPVLTLPGITDASWSNYGTAYGTTSHVQIAVGRVMLSNNDNTTEVHARTTTVSAAASFAHVFGLTPKYSALYSNAQDFGVLFTDGTKYSGCALHGATSDGYVSVNGKKATTSSAVADDYTPDAASAWVTFPLGTFSTVYFKLSWVASTHTMSCAVSHDGLSWLSVWSDSTPYLTPSAIGYYTLNAYGNVSGNALFAWGYR